MTSTPENNRDLRLLVLVGRFATPFAIMLVSLGIIFSQPPVAQRNLSVMLLVFSVIFNLLGAGVIRRLSEGRPWVKKARMLVNLAVNVVLVHQLGPFWPPMWLLLALTPIATAIYEGPSQTLIVSAGTSALILGIHLLRGASTPYEWGQTLSYAVFIVLMSLLINELTQASYPHHPQDRA
jgi:hypothetical protein